MRNCFLLFASSVIAVVLAGGVVLVGWQRPAVAVFPGTNGAIAFAKVVSHNEGGQDSHIVRMRTDGSQKKNLSQGPSPYHIGPNWSADGKKIVLIGEFIEEPNGCCKIDVFWMNADGSGVTNLTNSVADESDAAFFPDHHRIVFVRDGDLYEMTVDDNGSPLQEAQLTTSTALERAPAVSPYGARIAFERGDLGSQELYVMRAKPESAANTPVRITRNDTYDADPDWSPSGTSLAFASDRDGLTRIWKMKPKPSGPTNRPVMLTVSDNAWDRHPTWSPDGKKIAFARLTDPGAYDIYKKSSDGTGPTVNLTKGMCSMGSSSSSHASCVAPSWRPAP